MNLVNSKMSDRFKIFQMEDQQWFAQASGDWNPIHVDATFARREMTGRVVVHGVHVVVWALNEVIGDELTGTHVSSVTARFLFPIVLDAGVNIATVRRDGTTTTIHVAQKSRSVLVLSVSQGEGGGPDPEPCESTSIISTGRNPRQWDRDALGAATGQLILQIDMAAFAERYPKLVQSQGCGFVRDLVGLSTLVGMDCPGLHSLFSELFLARGKSAGISGKLIYQTIRWDARFSSLQLAVQGQDTQSKVKTFVRPAQRNQLSFTDAVKFTNGLPWNGRTVLVIGGSRGLGEVAAKLLAAAGAQVILTYHKGRQDAERVALEIQRNQGLAEAVFADIADIESLFNLLKQKNLKPTVALVFATPHLSADADTIFDISRFQFLSSAYLDGFYRVWKAMRELQQSHFAMFYPSTVYVDNPERGLIEYSAAKAAGEQLCHYLQGVEPRGRILIRRLPRLATDLTLSLIPSRDEDPVPVLQKVLEDLNFIYNPSAS
jgi:hypothetical protein